MAFVAGIDEAGLGPVLGPMVVSSASFIVPDDSLDSSLWRLLAGAAAKKPSKRSSLIAYCDSKKLYGGLGDAKGLALLERGVLAMLCTRQACPASLAELLAAVAPGTAAQAGEYPWYASAMPLPRCGSALAADLSGKALAARMEKTGVRLAGMRAAPVFEGEYNRLVRATDNKSRTVFGVTARLMAEAWAAAPAGEVRILVDRQGGKMRYLNDLQMIFEGCRFKIMDESEALRAYCVEDQRRRAEIRFAVQAEDRCLSVALASMMSKYVRELFMGLFNEFWRGRVPGIAPTAGYYTDGRRFYEQILPSLRAMGISDERLYRSR